jgi:ankyrin repeat protein
MLPQRFVRPLDVEPGHWKKQLAGKYRKIAQKGNLPGLRAMLREHPEFLSKRGSHGRTLLWEATRAGRLAAVELLVEAGADVNATGCYNSETLVQITPYCAGRYYGRGAIADYLWAHGSALDIFRAAFLGDTARVEQELASKPEFLYAEDPHDEIYYVPLLSFAIAGGHQDLARSLIRRGAQVEQYSAQLIHLAARSERRDLVELLRANGADVRAAGSGTFVTVSDLDLLRYLIGQGLSVNGNAADEFPPLVYVARGDKGERPDKIRLLVEHGANVNAAGPSGKTALHYAATAGHSKVVALLLEHGAGHALVDRNGQTPLSLSRAAGNSAVSDLLIARGANR